MNHHNGRPSSCYHFSFLKDIRIHGIYLNSFGRMLSQYPILSGEHCHDFYTFINITGGEGKVIICGNEYAVSPGSFLIIAPNQLHSFGTMTKAEGTIFFFCQDFYVEEFSFIRLLNTFSYVTSGELGVCGVNHLLRGGELNEVVPLFDSIRNEYETNGPAGAKAVIIRSYLNILLLRITEQYRIKSGSAGGGDSLFIQNLSNLIESYYSKEHKVSFYTSALNITEKHLNEICQRNFKFSLKRILQDRLLQESRKLLLSTELSVSEIAFKLNFSDNTYFNKVFKKETGITPKRFRELHKKLIP